MESLGGQDLRSSFGTGEPQVPYFFLSYAHTPGFPGESDPNHLVGRLFKDLCHVILQLTTLSSPEEAGFMDRQLRTGDGWPVLLGQRLATCRVFVPLYSPRYFSSAECGREWYAFSRRVQNARHTGNGEYPAIVPALWTPVHHVDLPHPAKPLQVVHDEYGAEYARDGFYGLIKVKRYEDAYHEAVLRLARRIVDVAHQSAPPPCADIDYMETPSAFRPVGQATRTIRLTVAAPARDTLPLDRAPDHYGSTALEWRSYPAETEVPVAKIAGEHVRSLDHQATTEDFDEGPSAHPPGEAHGGPHILVLDPWALDDELRRGRLAQFDSAAEPWTSLVVPHAHADLQNRSERGRRLLDQVAETLPELTGRGRLSATRRAVNGVPSLDVFNDVLPKVIAETTARFFRHAKAHPPAGDNPPRPRLQGPLFGQDDPPHPSNIPPATPPGGPA
ncbi:TIR-like protein FxsC [Streptomyces sp. VRA16 Mangrove soil]|uniref:TIR-like protein FxsC n=1 Tax=Streptomyces sp. VRA16 Mangrove soil TaxID=2817434 RepID=UPI001A9F1A44|nr:TIR-like protein FxsC [Streptomyces sp. VRA16 Mangrove soil]MBO1335094.1 FxsC protein [Streptomyces sp. VRA16 Mangrove soil]